MTAISAWRALLVQHPPLLAALVGGASAFLGAGVSGVSLAHVDAAGLAARSGVQWGTLAASGAVFVGGLAVLVVLKLTRAERALHWRSAAWTAFAAVSGPLAIWLGAAAGATIGAAGTFSSNLVLASAGLPGSWPVAAAAALLAFAIAGAGAEAPP